jgi:hypothetical protein
MTVTTRCPDCGVAVGQQHKYDCDVEPCSVCLGQRCSCECRGHDPRKSIWTGEWPLKNTQAARLASDKFVGDGFVIYGINEWFRPQSQFKPVPERRYSDRFLELNGRSQYQHFYVEPIYRDGRRTGEYRACRRCPDGWYEMAQFSTHDDAVMWGRDAMRLRPSNASN